MKALILEYVEKDGSGPYYYNHFEAHNPHIELSSVFSPEKLDWLMNAPLEKGDRILEVDVEISNIKELFVQE